MFSICHEVVQDHVIKVSYNFMSKNLSRQVTTQLSLVAIGKW